MHAFRIGSRRHAGNAADAFSGRGSLVAPGRWHYAGRPIIYAAQHLSLATLEILVHLDRASNIQPYVSFTLDIPDHVIEDPKTLPADWALNLESSRQFGDLWFERNSAAVLRVPSVIVPRESNLLLNPQHPDFSLKWITAGPDEVIFDPRLLA